ncbi:MAG: Crp/Fnr family transcriptional regulator [Syntrophales bacterium LBB04]|nr:Crp/Fnr family transcriptional regulator [Syntrophales bacterium LBB04]
MKLIDHIITLPLFEGLPKTQHEELATIALNRSYKKGRIIFSEGDEGKGFYAIISGRVKIFKVSPEGKEQILHLMGQGEIFGEVPVFTGQGYPAYAEAHINCSLLFFPRNAFIELIKKDPSLSLNMLAVLSWRLRRFATLIEDLSLKEVPGRLAAYLLYLSRKSLNKDEFDLDISKGQLASILGTIPETLSRILGKMSRQGLISSEGSRIRIMDRTTLGKIATEGKKLDSI